MSNQIKADLAMLAITVGWGGSFILTKQSLAQIETFNFLFLRFGLAFIISFIVFISRIKNISKETIKYSIILGSILFAHYALQTLGLNFTTASKSAFITGLNVVMVPIILAIIDKNVREKKVVLSAVLAIIGLGLLTLKQSITEINIGDLLTVGCAVVFSIYIILVGKYTVKVDSVMLAILQVGVVACLSFGYSMLFENPIIPGDSGVWGNILILSLVCTSGAFIGQNVAQRYTSPSHIALICTAEPVFAAMFGYLVFREILGVKGMIGAVMILTGMIISEVDLKSIFRTLPVTKKKRSIVLTAEEQNSCRKS